MKNANFILSCESTIDLPYSYAEQRGIHVMFYSYTVDGEVYEDDMQRNSGALNNFYELLGSGKLASTSQLNQIEYEEFFDQHLSCGDLLHIVFGSGMTKSIQNAEKAAEVVRQKYPNRKLVVIDSTCSCCGYGLLVDVAADMRDEGKTIDEVEKWVVDNRRNVHHQFYVTDLKYLSRSGRMTNMTALLGTVLNICPIMHLDNGGRIVAYDKVRGKKKAVKTTVDEMEKHAVGGTSYSGKCFVCHSDCLKEAEEAKAEVEKRFPNINGGVKIYDIGTIIASHCGPGTVAVFFFGDERINH